MFWGVLHKAKRRTGVQCCVERGVLHKRWCFFRMEHTDVSFEKGSLGINAGS